MNNIKESANNQRNDIDQRLYDNKSRILEILAYKESVFETFRLETSVKLDVPIPFRERSTKSGLALVVSFHTDPA